MVWVEKFSRPGGIGIRKSDVPARKTASRCGKIWEKYDFYYYEFSTARKMLPKKKWKWEIFTMTRNGSVTLRLGGKLYFNYRNWIMSVWKLSTWMEIGFRVEFHSTVTSTSPPWLTYSPPFFFLLQVEIIILGWTWVKRSFTIPSTTAVKASAALWMFIRARRKAKLHFFHIVFTSNKTESSGGWSDEGNEILPFLFYFLVFSLSFRGFPSYSLRVAKEKIPCDNIERGEWNSASHGRQLKHVAGRLKIARRNVLRGRGNWTATKCGGRGHKIFIFVDFLLPFKTQFRSAKWAHDLNVLEWVADDTFRSLPWWRREMVNSISHQHPTRINFFFLHCCCISNSNSSVNFTTWIEKKTV